MKQSSACVSLWQAIWEFIPYFLKLKNNILILKNRIFNIKKSAFFNIKKSSYFLILKIHLLILNIHRIF